MKILNLLMVAVFSVFIYTSCTSVKWFENGAYEFTKLPKSEIVKYHENTKEIMIKKEDGYSYYLKNWLVDSTSSTIEGNGICLNIVKDTIKTGNFKIELTSNDYIFVSKKDSFDNSIGGLLVYTATMLIAITLKSLLFIK